MVGVVGKTRLLVTHESSVVGEFDNYAQIAIHFGVSISVGGVITFMGEKRNPTYTMYDSENSHTFRNGFEPHEAVHDWAKNHMTLPRGHKIYRYLTN